MSNFNRFYFSIYLIEAVIVVLMKLKLKHQMVKLWAMLDRSTLFKKKLILIQF
jgi:hypothetical protein